MFTNVRQGAPGKTLPRAGRDGNKVYYEVAYIGKPQ